MLMSIRRKKTNPIWFVPLEELKVVVAQNNTLSGVLRHFGFVTEGAYHGILKTRVLKEGIDISHIALGRGHNKGRPGKVKKLPREDALKQIFVENSSKTRTVVKSYLKRYSLLEYKCECGNNGEWHGQPLSLQIDHINGIPNDHRLENLRWICPNCHSQTHNYAGKALANPDSAAAQHKERMRVMGPNWRKIIGEQLRKHDRPPKEKIQELVWEMPLVQIAKKLGVPAHQTIHKWCKEYEVKMPPKGYWRRRYHGYSHEESLAPLPKHVNKPAYTTPEQDSRIVQLYLEGYTMRAIASHLNIYKDGVRLRLERAGISIRRGWKGAKNEVI